MNIRFKAQNWLYSTCTFIEAVAVLLTNRARSRLGYPKKINSTDLFLKQFLLHALGRQSRLRITCAGRTDGAGAQAHTMISAKNFARAYGHTYVHTPFSEIDHADRPMEQWVEGWENLFNLGQGEELLRNGAPPALNYTTFHPRLYHAVSSTLLKIGSGALLNWHKPSETRTFFHPFFYYSDSNPDAYLSLIPELRKKFYLNGPLPKSNVLKVAVHLRRGDVTPAHDRRFTHVGPVFETAHRVKATLEAHQQDYTLSVYSEGRESDFAGLQEIGAKLFLNINAIWTLRQLTEADILIMSKSSFSYVAALISDGIKLYEPFWHSPLDSWILRKSGGGFSRLAFEQQLLRLLKERRNPGPFE